MNASDASTRPPRPRPTPRRVTVRDVVQLSPRMRRVTFEGGDLATFAWSGPAAHIKIVFPEPGSDELPEISPDGPRPATMRTYTPRRFDATAYRLDVDFVLHGEGPASTWAARARPGQPLVLMGPGPGYAIDPDAPWYVIAGDEAALPAIETLLEAVPASAGITAFVEVASADEIRTLPGRADVRWLVRDAIAGGASLERALAECTLPPGDGRIYVGCEADAMRRIRGMLVASSGIARERIVTRGYWRAGKRNHPDHDYAID
jgi:NADPH-dependent ferric siderophore reductase